MTKTAIAKRKRLNGNGLNLRQMKFVKGFIENGGNATKAYQAAGYSKKGADSGASQLLGNIRVTRAIQAALTEAGYSAEGVRSKLMVFAANDPRDFEPWFAGEKTLEELSASGVDTTTIQEVLVTIKPSAHGDQTTRKLRFYDAQLAVTTLGRMLGMLDERKSVNITGMVGVGALDLRDKSPEELASIQVALASGKPPPGLEQQMSADPAEQITASLIDEASE